MDKRAKLLEIIRKVSKKDLQPAADESLFDSGLLDSIMITDLVSSIESGFGIEIPDSDFSPRKFDSIERIEQYLESR